MRRLYIMNTDLEFVRNNLDSIAIDARCIAEEKLCDGVSAACFRGLAARLELAMRKLEMYDKVLIPKPDPETPDG